MTFSNIPERLMAVANLIEPGSLVADIGTDHAFLPIYLVKNKIADRCIASDIVDGPLKSAKKNISSAGLNEKITVVKSDGLDKVDAFTPQTIVIAGMGGETIRDIIAASKYCISASPTLILQPMTHCDALREYLYKNGFSVLSETVVQEKHYFYIIISAKFTAMPMQENLYDNSSRQVIYELGNILPQSSPAAERYLIWKRESAKKAASEIKNNADNKKSISKFENIVSEINRRLKNAENK